MSAPSHVHTFARAEAAAYRAVTEAAEGRISGRPDLGLHLTDAGSPTPFGNLAHLIEPVTEAQTHDLVDALASFYSGAPGGPFLVFSPGPTADLRPYGFTLVGHPPVMFRPSGHSTVATDLRIVRVEDHRGLDDFERTLAEAYPAPELLPFGSQRRLFNDSVLDTPWHLYVGYEGSTPVATAGAYVDDELVVVEAVSTRPECRGKGHGAAITAAATSALRVSPQTLTCVPAMPIGLQLLPRSTRPAPRRGLAPS